MIQAAKKENISSEKTAEAWAVIAEHRDQITEKEIKFFEENPGVLPWNDLKFVGKTQLQPFEAGKKKRKSIATHSADHWTEVLLENRKKEMARIKKANVEEKKRKHAEARKGF